MGDTPIKRIDMKKCFFIVLFLLLLITFRAVAADYDIRFDEDTTLKVDTSLSGSVYIKYKLRVPKGVTLTIKPGTVLKFERPGFCDDGNVDPSITVEGKIIAIGDKENPIIFTSAQKNERSAFGEVYIPNASDSTFEYCNFKYAHWALHVHDSNVTVKNCTVEESFGGIRFKGDKIIAEGNAFINNEISFRFWQGAPEIRNNTFKDVATAIFIREKVTGAVIQGNSFINIRDYYFKMGESQTDDVTVTGNSFGDADKEVVDGKIFDKEDDEYLGRVVIKDAQ